MYRPLILILGTLSCGTISCAGADNGGTAQNERPAPPTPAELATLVKKEPLAVVRVFDEKWLTRSHMRAIAGAIAENGVPSHHAELAFAIPLWQHGDGKDFYVESEDASLQRRAMKALYESASELATRRKVALSIAVLAGRHGDFTQERLASLSAQELDDTVVKLLAIFEEEHEINPPKEPPF